MRCAPPAFETIFRIPGEHRLESDGMLGRGGRVFGICWFHREYDRRDRLVARYETYDEVGADGTPRCGWRRYDEAGRLTLGHEIGMRWAALVESLSRREAETALQHPRKHDADLDHVPARAGSPPPRSVGRAAVPRRERAPKAGFEPLRGP